jgi:L-alanine-DL-glutamate epimerase-like enolase superfamily enzyme
MPIIESVSVAACEIPLDHVTSFSTRTVSARHYGLVKIRSVDGVEGIGFCYVGSRAGAIVKTAVEQLLGPLLIGKESRQTEVPRGPASRPLGSSDAGYLNSRYSPLGSQCPLSGLTAA